MAFTQAELAALKSAYASGTLEVSYEGKTVRYGSEQDLRRRIAFVEAEMAKTAGKPKPRAGFARFSRG